MKKSYHWGVVSIAVAAMAGAAVAGSTYVVEVDMTGWVADAAYGDLANSSVTITLPEVDGFTGDFSVTAIEFVGLQYSVSTGAWLSELVLSVNDGPVGAFWDYQPSSLNVGGTFGPASGSFAGAGSFGGPFDVQTGDLFVTAYTLWAPGTISIASGTLRISYVPAPGAIALLGVAGLVGSRRRRA
jgi:hypothetical protein